MDRSQFPVFWIILGNLWTIFVTASVLQLNIWINLLHLNWQGVVKNSLRLSVCSISVKCYNQLYIEFPMFYIKWSDLFFLEHRTLKETSWLNAKLIAWTNRLQYILLDDLVEQPRKFAVYWQYCIFHYVLDDLLEQPRKLAKYCQLCFCDIHQASYSISLLSFLFKSGNVWWAWNHLNAKCG